MLCARGDVSDGYDVNCNENRRAGEDGAGVHLVLGVEEEENNLFAGKRPRSHGRLAEK